MCWWEADPIEPEKNVLYQLVHEHLDDFLEEVRNRIEHSFGYSRRLPRRRRHNASPSPKNPNTRQGKRLCTTRRHAAIKTEYGLAVHFESCPFVTARWIINEMLSRTFPAKYNDMVVSKHNIAFGLCPHHLLPVIYRISLAYIPCGRCTETT